MRFFPDTANLEELKTGASWGILDGVTTNPTLIAKEGVAIEDQIHRIGRPTIASRTRSFRAHRVR